MAYSDEVSVDLVEVSKEVNHQYCKTLKGSRILCQISNFKRKGSRRSLGKSGSKLQTKLIIQVAFNIHC